MAGEQDREPLEEEEHDNNNNNNNNNNSNSNNSKAPRLPRWTRQEILVLIQGKRVAESRLMSRVGSGRVLGVVLEPKWASVSSYCKAHGVNRGPVQCRKRWSNLAGDYKKIKDWEESQKGEESESFWVMRNDLRRDRRLPGFFDKEVYDILDNATTTTTTATTLDHNQEQPPEEDKPEAATNTSTSTNVGLVLALGSTPTHTYTHTHGGGTDDVATAHGEEEDEEEVVVFFDSAPAKEGIFSDPEKEQPDKIPSPLPISEQLYSPLRNSPSSKGTNVGKDGFFNPEVGDTSGKGRKRKRSSSTDRNDDEETNVLQHQLISVLEKNGQMLNAHLQSQNTNSQMDREQRKDHVDSLVAVLGKLADALGRIADKL